MKAMKTSISTLLVLGTLGVSSAAWATNGYFTIGYGTKSRGMAGVAIGLPQDAMAAASNPAGISFVESRADAGMALFNPRRSATLDATGMFGDASSEVSGATTFLIPHAGYIRKYDDFTASLVMYANGGMNTRYNRNVFAEAFGPSSVAFGGPSSFPNSGTLGVNLAQLIFTPTVAMTFGESQSVGIGLLLGYQRFRSYGLGLFSGFSDAPDSLTNNGDDDAWGGGVRIGWTGKFGDRLTLGATAASRIYMQEFDKYKGLFSEQGDMDIPANFGIGLAYELNPRTTIGFDVVRILYSDVKTTGNKGPTGQEFVDSFGMALMNIPIAKPMGTDDGFGFGWEDQTVYKLGVSYDYNDHWTLRAGYNYGKSPIDDDQNLLNIISLAVVEQHFTLGFTYQPNDRNELSFSYIRAMREDQTYTYEATIPGPANVSYTAEIGMDQHALELSYAWKF